MVDPHPDETSIAGPLLVTHTAVAPEWIDYNGHMNVAYYVLMFDHATDAVLDLIALGENYRAKSSCSVFVSETHVTYERELNAEARVAITSWITDCDDRKRFVVYHEMWTQPVNELAATNEVLCVHVDLVTRRSALLPDDVRMSIKSKMVIFDNDIRAKRLGRAIRIRPSPQG